MIKDPHSVIQTIRLSEKATRLGEENNEYVFIVDPKANKIQIKEAVETIFEVTVTNVNTMVMPAKRGKRGRNWYGRTKKWKKAGGKPVS